VSAVLYYIYVVIRCTLLMPEQGKVYSVEGTTGKIVLKNMVVKEVTFNLPSIS
jgi:hypothetical protein